MIGEDRIVGGENSTQQRSIGVGVGIGESPVAKFIPANENEGNEIKECSHTKEENAAEQK
jgi:hypothetical protein